jgi:hypothetical protein
MYGGRKGLIERGVESGKMAGWNRIYLISISYDRYL